MPVPERLQKLLAFAGYGSRRKCELLMLEGRVTVNGAIITELGTKADIDEDAIAVDGKRLQAPKLVYVLMNKPVGVVTTMSDPRAGKTVADLLPRLPAQVHPVGRLDRDTEGALLLTNDGQLTNRLTHPRYGVEKTYRVVIDCAPSAKEIEKLENGVKLVDGRTAPARARLLGIDGQTGHATVELTIHEGRNRQVRRMLEAVGHKVIGLRRTAFGGLTSYKLPKGACRLLSRQEVAKLKKHVGL
jgi:23S rRNA pseudouridine2605 synthase